jgi:hypothetical protein
MLSVGVQMDKNIMTKYFSAGQLFLWHNERGFCLFVSDALVYDNGEWRNATELDIALEIYYNAVDFGYDTIPTMIMKNSANAIHRSIDNGLLIPI